jgi:hypothetical protein
MNGPRRNTRLIATTSVVAVVVGLGAVVFSGFGWAAVSHGTRSIRPAARAAGVSHSFRSNRSAARADAVSLLGKVRLPAGATRSATVPPDAATALSMPASSLPGAVDDHRWWVVPGSRDQVIAYVTAHPPAGSELLFTGGGTALRFPSRGTQDFSDVGFSLPPIGHVLGTRELVVSAAGLPGDETGVRVDAEVQPILPRPASERIPAGAERLIVSVERFGHRLRGPFSFTGRRTIARTAAILNALPAAQPGAVACPLDTGVTIRLTFQSGVGATPLAVAIYDPTGCGGVTLTLRGVREPPLASEPVPGWSSFPPLIDRLDTVLGVKLSAGPPQ